MLEKLYRKFLALGVQATLLLAPPSSRPSPPRFLPAASPSTSLPGALRPPTCPRMPCPALTTSPTFPPPHTRLRRWRWTPSLSVAASLSHDPLSPTAPPKPSVQPSTPLAARGTPQLGRRLAASSASVLATVATVSGPSRTGPVGAFAGRIAAPAGSGQTMGSGTRFGTCIGGSPARDEDGSSTTGAGEVAFEAAEGEPSPLGCPAPPRSEACARKNRSF